MVPSGGLNFDFFGAELSSLSWVADLPLAYQVLRLSGEGVPVTSGALRRVRLPVLPAEMVWRFRSKGEGIRIGENRGDASRRSLDGSRTALGRESSL